MKCEKRLSALKKTAVKMFLIEQRFSGTGIPQVRRPPQGAVFEEDLLLQKDPFDR